VIDVEVFGLVVMIVVTIGVVVLILLFERKRAQEIEQDLGSGGGRTSWRDQDRRRD
jgi:hypothetical protein